MSALHQLSDREWTRPVHRGYLLACCNCGLTHKMDFRIRKVGKRLAVEFRAVRVKRK